MKKRSVFVLLLVALISLFSFASALAGSDTGIDVVNISDSAGTVSVEFFDGAGVSQGSVSDTITAFGSLNFYVPSLSVNLGAGQYSAVVSSDVPVAATVGLTDGTESMADNYLGTSEPSQELSFPLIYRNHGKWVSQIIVQNATGTAQNVDIEFFPTGSLTAAATDSANIAAFSYAVFNMADYAAFGDTYGAAIVTGADVLAGTAIANLDKGIGAAGKAQTTYRAFSPSQQGQSIIGPLFYRGHGGYETGVNVLNTSKTVSTTVTALYTYSGGSGAAGGSWTFVKADLQPGEMYTFYGPSLTSPIAMPSPIYGSVEVSSTNADIAVVVSHSKNKNGNIQAFAYEGAVGTSASSCVAAPIVQNRATSWKSGINIFNTSGTPATVQVDYASSNPSTPDATQTVTVPANSPFTIYMPSDMTTAVNFYGGAKIQATSGEDILVLATTSNGNSGVAINYMGVNYTCP